MPSIPLYADEADLAEVVRWFSDDEEIAFIVSAGPKHWIARHALEGVHFNRIALWHIPSGPLPLVPGRAWQRERWIEDPMRGWKERQTGLDPTVPFFGGGHPGIIWLNAETAGPNGEEIGMSGFEWIGNRYRPEGLSARPPAEQWWRRLEERIRSNAVQVTRLGPLDGPDPEIWALPGALSRLRSGAIRAINP
jgi:hypothetical protein